MRYVATYLLAVLGGNANPSAQDIKCILGSVGIEANDEHLNKVVSELNGKDIDMVINSGLSRLASVPAGAGGGGMAAPAESAASAASPEPARLAAVDDKRERKEESEESDDDMGFGLFD